MYQTGQMNKINVQTFTKIDKNFEEKFSKFWQKI